MKKEFIDILENAFLFTLLYTHIFAQIATIEKASKRFILQLNMENNMKKEMELTEKHAKYIYGDYMTPCVKCGSWDFMPQTPIKLKENLPENFTPKQLLGVYARAVKGGQTELLGPCYFICKSCGHKGPAVDCTGLTREFVGKNPEIYAEMKRLWNEET